MVASTGVVEKIDDIQSSSNTQLASTSENTTPTAIGNNKSWGSLRGKILASPSLVQQGDKVIFSIDTSQLTPETTTFSYFWKHGSQTGNKPTFEVDTTSLSAGEYKVNVTLYTKAQGETKKTALPGGALFKVEKSTDNRLGVIDMVVHEIGSETPIIGEEYLLEFEGDTSYSQLGVTGDNGSIKLSNVPIGNYTLHFTNTELTIINQQ